MPTTGTTTTRSAVAAELARLQEILPAASATIPTPSATTVERNYLTAIAVDVQHVWGREFVASHLTYRPARVVVFANKVKSDCGRHEDSGPFYCPADESVYLDLRFFSELPDNAGVGIAAQGYIVAHEFAHHVQQLIGIAAKVADANRADPHGQKARSVQIELQADCLAGVWGRSAFPRSKLTTGDLDAALKAADVIGDDYIQQAAGQLIDSTLWTHGSSQQRQYWLRTGYQTGRPSACDTFAGDNRTNQSRRPATTTDHRVAAVGGDGQGGGRRGCLAAAAGSTGGASAEILARGSGAGTEVLRPVRPPRAME